MFGEPENEHSGSNVNSIKVIRITITFQFPVYIQPQIIPFATNGHIMCQAILEKSIPIIKYIACSGNIEIITCIVRFAPDRFGYTVHQDLGISLFRITLNSLTEA